jgi:hypothetical protein
MGAIKDRHDARLAAIRTWLETFPPGVVIADVKPENNGVGGTLISIRPLHSPKASDIDIHMDRDSGFVYLGAGKGFSLDDTYWPDMPLVKILQAIVDGKLVEEVRLVSGKEVGVKGWLQVEGEKTPAYDNRSFSLTDDLYRMVAQAVTGKRETKTIHYPPYILRFEG